MENSNGAIHAEEDFAKVRDALEVLSKAPIYIDDKPGQNILSMRAVARRLKRERGIGLIIVDYLQLMAPTNTRQSDSMVQQVTEIARSLKQLARELRSPCSPFRSSRVPWSSVVVSPASLTSAIQALLSRMQTSLCSSTATIRLRPKATSQVLLRFSWKRS